MENDVYHNTEDESQPPIDWYRESRKLKRKKWKISPIHGNREHFCMNSQEADSECILLQLVVSVNVEQIMLKSHDKVDACSHFHACLIHVVSLELSRWKKSP